MPTKDPSNLLIGQPDGTFVEGAEAAGLVDFEKARGAALVDLNLDGMLDLVKVVRQRERRAVSQCRHGGGSTAPEPMGSLARRSTSSSDGAEPRRDRRVGRRCASATA